MRRRLVAALVAGSALGGCATHVRQCRNPRVEPAGFVTTTLLSLPTVVVAYPLSYPGCVAADEPEACRRRFVDASLGPAEWLGTVVCVVTNPGIWRRALVGPDPAEGPPPAPPPEEQAPAAAGGAPGP